MHCHVYHGVTSFGLRPDDIGLRQGVHLLVDAGSAGAETWPGFRDYVIPRYKTRVMAFLNISAIGLVTMREAFDLRNLDPARAAECVRGSRLLAGIKVRSSGQVVEDRGLQPLLLGLQAARQAGVPVMVHMGEHPPDNQEILPLLGQGDIITHCFHGKAEPLWGAWGQPIPAMEAALARGVLMDVGHGAASCSADVAKAAAAGRSFVISTDLHGRSISHPVGSLARTMTKFLSLGLGLEAVVHSASLLPASILGLGGWGSDPERDSTVFCLRPPVGGDGGFVDSSGRLFPVNQVIQPVAVVIDGKYMDLEDI